VRVVDAGGSIGDEASITHLAGLGIYPRRWYKARRRIDVFVKPRARIVPFLTICLAASSTIVSPAWGAVTSSVIDGVLTITGDEQEDQIRVSCGADATVLINEADPDTGPAPCAEVTSMVVTSGGRADHIDLQRVRLTAFPALSSVTIDAGRENDTVWGSDAPDVIAAGVGNDRIFADPTLEDAIEGGEGSDRLFTSIDSDVTIMGDAFTTPTGTFTFAAIEIVTLSGGRSPQTIDGRPFSGDLFIYGGGGDDRILGGSGKNHLRGDRGNDHIVGGPDDDYLDGSDGRDVLIGMGGDDFLVAFSDNDRLRGGRGHDAFCCVFGSDNALFSGGPGIDSVRAFLDFGTAVLSDSFVTSQGDTARLRSIEEAFIDAPDAGGGIVIDASRFSGSTHLEGGTFGGADLLIGGSGRDKLFGLDDDDALHGGGGRDVLDGGPGTDACDGGPGADRITHCE
jgi:Ca2+-binding RTX toxin-like protein